MIRAHHILCLAGVLVLGGCAVDKAADAPTNAPSGVGTRQGSPSSTNPKAVATDPEARAALMKVSEPLGVAFGIPRGWSDLGGASPERTQAIQKETGMTAADLETVTRTGGIITMSGDDKVRVSLLAAPGTAVPAEAELAKSATEHCGAKPEIKSVKAGGRQGLGYHCAKDGRFKHVFVGKSNKAVFTLATNSMDEKLAAKIHTQALESIHYT